MENTHPNYHYGVPHTTIANPGSPEWAAGAAFAGRVIGGLPGLVVAAATATEGEPSYAGAIVRWIGQVGGAAGGAAMGAPEGLKGRAAVGAAIGGAIPFLGAPLAAVGAYIATRPSGGRAANPMSTGAMVALSLLGLGVLGGGTYFGVKALKKRQEDKELGPGNGNGEAATDDWGWNLDQYSHWGAGPVTGQDGEQYSYVIYFDLVENLYWVDFRGPGDTGPDAPVGPFSTSDEAVAYVETQLPAT